MEFITKSPGETEKLGQKTSVDLVSKGKRIFALTGDLGSGKTTFVKGFAKGLGVKGPVISPTFIILRSYRLKAREGEFYHVDLYRLEANLKEEIENLGIKDLFGEKESILIIEWAEKIREYLPKETVWIKFEYLQENERKIIID